MFLLNHGHFFISLEPLRARGKKLTILRFRFEEIIHSFMYSPTLSLIYPFNEHTVSSFTYQTRKKKNEIHVSVMSMFLTKILKIKKYGKILQIQS